MATKKKLTLAAVKKVVGVGGYVEVPVKFKSENGEEFEGHVLVKRLSHNDRIKSLDEWSLEDKSQITVDHVTRAYVFASIYSKEDEKFFPDIETTGDVSPEFVTALYVVSEAVNDFSGKSWISNQKNSGVNSSSTASVEEPLKKPNKK